MSSFQVIWPYMTSFYSVRVKYSSKMTFVEGHSTRRIHWNKNLHCVTFAHIKVRNCLIKVLETIKTNRNENFGIYTLKLKFQISESCDVILYFWPWTWWMILVYELRIPTRFVYWMQKFYFRKIYRPHYLTSPKCPKICVTRSIDLNGLIQYLACLEIL